MEPILHGLNEAQKAAVTSSASVLQVLAPPGSGKTKTLTSRVAYLLAHHGFAPWNVICCTFTVKASNEMRERLRGMIGNGKESRLVLGTFHSICRRYLVRYGRLISLPKNFGIADSDDSLSIVKRIVKRLKLGIDPRSGRSKISQFKSRGETPEDLPQEKKKTIDAQEFVTLFYEYEAALKNSNLLDYDDLLLRCVDLLRAYPNCVANVEALLIDEFQDTNIVQFELMKLLASAKQRVTIVGDPDQSIYRFRSAEIENLLRMRAYYPEAVVINLEENYRSSSSILRLAQEVIEQDFERPEKQLKATHQNCTLPVLRRLPNPYEEAQWITAEIRRIMTMTGNMIQHNDVAILLRSAFLSLHVEKALASVGIPYRMVGGKRFFDRVEIRVIIDYLRTISHPENNSALLSIINTPKRKVGETTVKELSRIALERNEPLWTTLQKILSGQISSQKTMPKASEQGLRELVRLVSKARQKMEGIVPNETPHKLIEYVISSLKYEDFLKKNYPQDHEDRWENVKELLTQAQDAVEHLNTTTEDLPEIEGLAQERPSGPEEMLAQFLANISLSPAPEDDSAEVQSTVTISTIHSAKGLEWPVVFVPAVYEGSIPHSRAESIDEERRLLYVAMTRAKVLLYMTFPIHQSRDAKANWGSGDTVLTQFLPTNTLPFTSETGAVFTEGVVADIANVIGRQKPFQEDLTRALQKMKEKESKEDDVWPSDGTHRSRHGTPSSDESDDHPKPGGKFYDAATLMKMDTGPQINHDGSPNLASILKQALLDCECGDHGGFTTAGVHLMNNPQMLASEPSACQLTKSQIHHADKLVKKPKLQKSITNQSNIRSFFTTGPPKLTQTISLPDYGGSDQQTFRVDTKVEHSQHRHHPEATVPSELAKHRLGESSTAFQHPRALLRASTMDESTQSQKRNHYAAFSSSPIREQAGDIRSTGLHPDMEPDEDDVYEEETSVHDMSTTANTVNDDLPPTEATGMVSTRQPLYETRTTITTTISQLSNRPPNHHPSSSYRQNSNTTQHQTSHTDSPSSVMTTMDQLQTDATDNGVTRYRTLGVRRSMNGWAARRHK